MSTPANTLLAHGDLVHRFEHNRQFAGFVRDTIASQYRRDGGGSPTVSDRVMAGIATQIRLADVYRVTPDMCDVVRIAAGQLDESDRIDRTLPPTTWGLVRFEKPLPMRDVRGKTLLIHWASWGPGTVDDTGAKVLFVTLWNDVLDEPDDGWRDIVASIRDPQWLAQTVGRWALIGGEFLTDGESLGPAEISLSDEQVAHYAAEHPGVDVVPYTNARRYLHALWLLLNQTITTVEREDVPSRLGKRFGKMRIPGRINIVRLRRTESRRSEGETYVEWQHRWMVRAHWAWRVCGPDHPDAQHGAPVKGGIGVRKYIHEYIKGPEDRPLAATPQRLFQLSR